MFVVARKKIQKFKTKKCKKSKKNKKNKNNEKRSSDHQKKLVAINLIDKKDVIR